jgi:hypothetical protein
MYFSVTSSALIPMPSSRVPHDVHGSLLVGVQLGILAVKGTRIIRSDNRPVQPTDRLRLRYIQSRTNSIRNFSLCISIEVGVSAFLYRPQIPAARLNSGKAIILYNASHPLVSPITRARRRAALMRDKLSIP